MVAIRFFLACKSSTNTFSVLFHYLLNILEASHNLRQNMKFLFQKMTLTPTHTTYSSPHITPVVRTHQPQSPQSTTQYHTNSNPPALPSFQEYKTLLELLGTVKAVQIFTSIQIIPMDP